MKNKMLVVRIRFYWFCLVRYYMRKKWLVFENKGGFGKLGVYELEELVVCVI